MLRFSRPETNEEVFEIAGPDDDVVALVQLVARSLPSYIQWETYNEQIEYPDTHMGRWKCDLKPIGYVDENLTAHLNPEVLEELNLVPERAKNTTEGDSNGR